MVILEVETLVVAVEVHRTATMIQVLQEEKR
ncbi:hypothetical protein J2T16_005523 [Paenibacillus intestini]|nr:hypothetical protein [Paenibacillus intestini]